MILEICVLISGIDGSFVFLSGGRKQVNYLQKGKWEFVEITRLDEPLRRSSGRSRGGYAVSRGGGRLRSRWRANDLRDADGEGRERWSGW